MSHAAIIADLKKHAEIFDFTQDNLAVNLMDITATSILATMDAELDIDGRKWPALGVFYAKWKAKVSPGSPIGVLWGHMKQITQIRGTRSITPELATMTYGDDPIAMHNASSFQEGGPHHPARRFYGLAPWTITLLDTFTASHFARKAV